MHCKLSFTSSFANPGPLPNLITCLPYETFSEFPQNDSREQGTSTAQVSKAFRKTRQFAAE